MRRFITSALVLGGLVSVSAIAVLPRVGYAQGTYTGTVERVWEDGFRLNTGERTFKVDSWDVYGDNTSDHIEVGDLITVEGEFEGREFDAFSIDQAETPNP
ncbi:MAG: hypothetical protein F6J95_006455 [Leptolyngbya sp. SIO1E4]|nr:hypothetical protein [Leptolyngbya sp. SIO1E4]